MSRRTDSPIKTKYDTLVTGREYFKERQRETCSLHPEDRTIGRVRAREYSNSLRALTGDPRYLLKCRAKSGKRPRTRNSDPKSMHSSGNCRAKTCVSPKHRFLPYCERFLSFFHSVNLSFLISYFRKANTFLRPESLCINIEHYQAQVLWI